MTDKLDFDPYELLALSEECSQQDVIRAYRKTALIWHPDKNPSQKDFAQQMFLKVAKALEILCDPAAKAALDRLRHAHRINVERNKHLDERRRKLKEELEAREFGLVKTANDEAMAAERLAAEVRWTDPHAVSNSEQLRAIFEKFGEVISVVLSLRKKSSAVVEFASLDAAKLAVDHSNSQEGFPFTVSLLCDKLRKMNLSSPLHQPEVTELCSKRQENMNNLAESANGEMDFEALVLKKMRQAQERKKVIAAMKLEEQTS